MGGGVISQGWNLMTGTQNRNQERERGERGQNREGERERAKGRERTVTFSDKTHLA